MSRLYVATFAAVAATAAQDLFEIVASSSSRVLIHGWEIGQSTEAGDAQDEMARLELILGYTVSGSGGSSFTPLPLDAGHAAFGGTCEINNTTLANTGTAKVMHPAAYPGNKLLLTYSAGPVNKNNTTQPNQPWPDFGVYLTPAGGATATCAGVGRRWDSACTYFACPRDKPSVFV